MLLVCTTIFAVSPAAAWFGDDDTLLTIDGGRYTGEDFKRWWGFWKEEGQELPETPDAYVDWLLLAREGERMELDSDPSFKRQDLVFLQSRTLLMLKYEVVDSQINVTDADLQAHYEKRYTPRWQVQRMNFPNPEAAAAAWQELQAGSLTVEELQARDSASGGPASVHENWVRPTGIDPGWLAIFEKTSVGDVIDPAEHEGGVALFYMKDTKGPDEEDFGKLRDQVAREVWKEQESRLTIALLDQLREKYEAKVDEERLAALDVNAAEDTFTDEVLISTSRQKLTEKQFMAMARREMSTRPGAAHSAFDEKEAGELKARVVGGFLAQNLTNWEAIDRHYEEKEPFKWEYDFQFRHRLTTFVENRLFTADTKVSDEEVKQHYENNLAKFTQPAMVKLYIIDDTLGPVDQIWADAVSGKDFARTLRQHFGRHVPGQEVPANHLDPEIKAVVDKLAAGETSQPFTAQGSRVVVHLIERIPERPLPLEMVNKTIHPRLMQEKIAEKRKAYLEVLRSGSKIEVKNRKWQAVRKELGGGK